MPAGVAACKALEWRGRRVAGMRPGTPRVRILRTPGSAGAGWDRAFVGAVGGDGIEPPTYWV